MNGGVKSLLVVASLAAASCSAAPGEVKIRPIADPASKMRPGDDRLADAKAQLALGNVGLALEGFRRGSREAPDSAEAFAGMAACYDAMGRYDLAQSNYEAALALAPRNAALLTALAGSLDRQGKRDAAAEVRNEVALLNAAAAALDQTQAEPDQASASADAAPSVTVALPPARPIASAPVAPAAPAMKISDIVAEVNLGADGEPRLERLSLGEVALVTDRGPIWRGQVVSRSARSVTVRWVPLTTASARPNIRLLNAARQQGLAARTREYLLGRGWRKIEIGDSTEIRGESIVLYPAARRVTGRSLAAQFGFRARAVEKGDVFVVLLGRDAARPSQTRG
jgi:tetratricopeptide (TPR) repeat protein